LLSGALTAVIGIGTDAMLAVAMETDIAWRIALARQILPTVRPAIFFGTLARQLPKFSKI
jgi:hypothetical protein